jgi:hypothetical protein
MKKYFLLLLFTSITLFAQQENVSLDNDVYFFLKEMNVKKIIEGIHDDNPNMSRYEVGKFLATIENHKADLSATEFRLLKKYKVEFYDELSDNSNTYQMFGSGNGFSEKPVDLLSDKIKYTYASKDSGGNFYLNVMGRILVGQVIKPVTDNSELYDIGVRLRGTLFNHLGYNLTVQKGTVSGSDSWASTFDPRVLCSFKYIEAMMGSESMASYDFTEGYLRYYWEPAANMKLSLQLGREKIKFGYGYGSKLIISGDHPSLDFFRLNFDYGIFGFTSITASTVGKFYLDRNLDQTKYLAINRFKLNIPNLFEFGLGENIIYAGRGIDLAYLNPMSFYKFAEMSLQDRDNGTLWIDFQTHCIKNFEISGTFFLDEDILSNMQDLTNFRNKTAYQLGAFWYSPFAIYDLSLICEYTKIRPYVYTHEREITNYTSFGQLIGHPIGPNADELLLRASYNINENLNFRLDYQYIRNGKNVYDSDGNLLFNAGGDPFVPYRWDIDPEDINFLEGIRINQNIFTATVKYEPIRKFAFDLTYKLIATRNETYSISSTTSYAMLRLLFEI